MPDNSATFISLDCNSSGFAGRVAVDVFAIDLITDLHELAMELELDVEELRAISPSLSFPNFPLRVPRSFVKRMQKGNIDDPLLLQVLPSQIEFAAEIGYSQDPLDEQTCSPIPGLLHKYYGRALLLLTSDCCINCRFCFRRYMRQRVEKWDEALKYIAENSALSEVILSGGEPLLWSDDQLSLLIAKLANIPHLKRIRIHSRIPILAPQRITQELVKVLIASRLKVIFVIHCNHAQELDEEVGDALYKLRLAGIVLLNQSVLLRGINDNVLALVELSEALFAVGVVPYYLHILDKVSGSAHFCVEREVAKKLIDQVAGKISGYLVPRLVYEESTALSKIRL